MDSATHALRYSRETLLKSLKVDQARHQSRDLHMRSVDNGGNELLERR